MPALPVSDLYAFCPRCGAAEIGRAETKANSIRCGACGFVLFFNPTSSAAALIFDADGRLLAIERARDPAKGKYGLPGGFADPGERLEDVLVREVQEEVNLRVESFQFLASFPNEYIYKDVNYPVIDVYFTAIVESLDALQAEASEVAGIRFVDPAAVPEDQWAFPALRAAIRFYLARKAQAEAAALHRDEA